MNPRIMGRAFVLAAATFISQSAIAQILIGQSAGLTGGQADYSKDVRDGILAYFEVVNRAGGIDGQPLNLITEDDQGKRDLVVANSKKPIERDKVFTLNSEASGARTEPR